MTGREAIPTERACQSWLSGCNICPVKGIIFTFGSAGHAIGTAVLINGQPEGIDKATQVNDGTDGTVCGAVHHTALFSRHHQDKSEAYYPKTNGQQGGG